MITTDDFQKSVARTQSDDNSAMVEKYLDSHGGGDAMAVVMSRVADAGLKADQLKKIIFHGHDGMGMEHTLAYSYEGRTAGPVHDFLTRLRSSSSNDLDGGALIMTALGLAGEVAEFVAHIYDCIYAHDPHAIDLDYIRKELGDIMWYVGRGANAILQFRPICYDTTGKIVSPKRAAGRHTVVGPVERKEGA